MRERRNSEMLQRREFGREKDVQGRERRRHNIRRSEVERVRGMARKERVPLFCFYSHTRELESMREEFYLLSARV